MKNYCTMGMSKWSISANYNAEQTHMWAKDPKF